jgi:mannosyltransferase
MPADDGERGSADATATPAVPSARRPESAGPVPAAHPDGGRPAVPAARRPDSPPAVRAAGAPPPAAPPAAALPPAALPPAALPPAALPAAGLPAVGLAPSAGRARRVRVAAVLRWLVVLVPGVAELGIGGFRIGRASLWRDEGYTREVAQRSWVQIVDLLRHQDAVHGAYYLGMHLVIDMGGASATALRVPSLIAASLAAMVTAALGRRLAGAAGLPAPGATGLLAGLLLAGLPLTTWYAQDARPYAAATLLAVVTSYLLARAVTEDRGRWWWAGYGAAAGLLAVLSLVALLLLAGHGITLLVIRRRAAGGAAASGVRAATRRWMAAVAAAGIGLSPLAVFAARQNTQLNWVPRPTLDLAGALVTDLAGARNLIPLALALALAGVAADVGRRHRAVCPPAALTVPWLVLPPVLLLTVSVAHPVYDERYVVFCTPAAALLMAGGLVWLAGLLRMTPAGRDRPAVALVPALALVAVIAIALVAPQQHARTTAARLDDLRRVSAIVAAGERPGDAVIFMPWNTRVASLAYPDPFRRLRDIGMLRSPIASATLTGIPVAPALMARRLASVRRVWLVRWHLPLPSPPSPLVREELTLLRGLRLVGTWTVRSVVLSLYAKS